jgi:hypothetical protein
VQEVAHTVAAAEVSTLDHEPQQKLGSQVIRRIAVGNQLKQMLKSDNQFKSLNSNRGDTPGAIKKK